MEINFGPSISLTEEYIFFLRHNRKLEVGTFLIMK